MPVWFREEPFAAQQRLFYALEALGLVPTLHRKVFHAIHVERTRLRTRRGHGRVRAPERRRPVKFIAAYNSFGVQSKALQARQTAAAYKIDAVPAMGVHGRYYTNGNLANAGAPPRLERPHAGGRRRARRKVRQGGRA